jgi:hypothetical protein
MTPMQVCHEAGSRAVVAKRRYAAFPLGGGNPQLPAHSVEGSRLGPFKLRGVLAGFSHDKLEMAGLPRQRH